MRNLVGLSSDEACRTGWIGGRSERNRHGRRTPRTPSEDSPDDRAVRVAPTEMNRPNTSTGKVRIGISGWRYPGWRGDWYPRGVPQREELEYSSRRLNSIELNGSFYSLQRPQNYLAWYAQTPDEFTFAVKGARFITHLKRLQNVETAVANFFASGVLALRDKLGPILWQLPERHAFDADQLERFFALLPRTTSQALSVARKHDARVDDRAWLEPQPERPLRHALEARHPEFIGEQVAELSAPTMSRPWARIPCRRPQNRDLTSDFVYVRLHGAEELYSSGYTSESLDAGAADIVEWSGSGHDVYVYFDNDMKVRAPFDAMALAARLGIAWPPVAPTS